MRFKLLFFIFFIFFKLSSQETSFVKSLYKKYDLKKLTKLSIDYKLKYSTYKSVAINYAKSHNLPIRYIKNNNLYEIQKIINDTPVYLMTYNLDALNSTRTNTLHSGGSLNLGLDGQNMTAYIWDGGIARGTHQEYQDENGQSRYSVGDYVTNIDVHSTHVTGTIISRGVVQNSIGMLPNGNAIGFDWNNDVSEITTQVANGMLVSNHSYGDNVDSLPDYYFGAYTETSRDIDNILYNASYYLLVTAAGNSGLNNSVNGTPLNNFASYDKLSSMTCSKNTLVVANSNDANIVEDQLINVVINPSSSQGPTDDLRIKPDISGNGTNVYSTSNDSDLSYISLSGTSMASPNVAGSLLLLQQLYYQLNSDYMYGATLKGLVLHTADDFGSVGPDAISGWGLLNSKQAAITILNNGETSIIEQNVLDSGDIYSTSITSNEDLSLVVSVSWFDPPGNINNGIVNDSTPVLINDLDVRVIDSDGVVYFPYRLSSVNSNEFGDNTVDPYEKIIIDNPSGTYTIQVSHKGNLFSGSQNYSLIVTGINYTGNCDAIAPTNLNASLFFGNATFTWNNVLGASYELRYRPITNNNWIVFDNIVNESFSIDNIGTGLFVAQLRSFCSSTGEYSEWVTFNNPPNFVLSNASNELNKDFYYRYNNGELSIIFNNNLEKELTLYDFLGKTIYQTVTSDSTFDLSDNNLIISGLYLIRVKIKQDYYFKKIFIK